MRLLFVSNGHGEDSMAAAIIAQLPPGLAADAYPTLGSGAAYQSICPIVGPRAFLPSEGWRNTAGSVLRDLQGGVLSTFGPAVRFMRNIRHAYPKTVVVGDLVGLVLCWHSGVKVAVYVDAFRNGYAHSYSPPERWLIKAAAQTVFCRDDLLARELRSGGIDARAAGNIMMDTIPYAAYDPAPRRTGALALAILPGSRATAVDHFATQIAALRLLPKEKLPDLFVAVAPGVDPVALAEAGGLNWANRAGGEVADLGRLEGDGLIIHLAAGALGNLIEASDAVLSQAGTATWQAIGLGRPVISFIMPADRLKRLRDEAAFTGESRVLCPRDPIAIAAALTLLLADPEERARRGRVGRARMGGPGAIQAILKELA
ncbi:MAG: hypothetical protein WEB63_09350 [Cucumibacter sp.]